MHTIQTQTLGQQDMFAHHQRNIAGIADFADRIESVFEDVDALFFGEEIADVVDIAPKVVTGSARGLSDRRLEFRSLSTTVLYVHFCRWRDRPT